MEKQDIFVNYVKYNIKDNDIEIIKQIQKKLFNKKFGNKKNNTNITIKNGTNAINLTVSN